MIKDKAVVSRYGEAFFNFAKENYGQDKALADLLIVKKIIHDNPGFTELMDNPEISYTEKCTIIDKVVKDDISADTRDLLKLLLEKNVLIYF